MKILIRDAVSADLCWINQQYNEVGFLPSTLENEEIVIAEADDVRVGIGRLQKIAPMQSELGGIFVSPDYRKLGIAREIVAELIDKSKKYNRVYCLPFSDLYEFYSSFGLIETELSDGIPDKILKKHEWCNSFYDKDVLLLSMRMD